MTPDPPAEPRPAAPWLAGGPAEPARGPEEPTEGPGDPAELDGGTGQPAMAEGLAWGPCEPAWVPGDAAGLAEGLGELAGDAAGLAEGHREPASGPGELYELGSRLLEGGEAAEAAEAFALGLRRMGPGDPGRGQLLGGLGIARLEQAVSAFAEAVECGDGSVRPLAVELLARSLPLRGRDDEAALAWQRGAADRDPEVAAAVRTRLRHTFETGAEPAQEFWWDAFLESAVCHGTLAVLASELFGALDHMYALAAVPLARRARERGLWEALAAAVRVPEGYAWGPSLQASFRQRLRDAMGADVLPPGWPEAG